MSLDLILPQNKESILILMDQSAAFDLTSVSGRKY